MCARLDIDNEDVLDEIITSLLHIESKSLINFFFSLKFSGTASTTNSTFLIDSLNFLVKVLQQRYEVKDLLRDERQMVQTEFSAL